jgi:type II secretory pathway pseudopilin PulG
VRRSEHGFTLIEVLLASACFIAVAFAALETVRQLSAASAQLAARHLGTASLERLGAQLRAEARSATAIWSSAPVAGAAHDDCVEVDFFTADAAGPHFWSYRSFPNHAAVEAVPGDALQRLSANGPIPPCDPSQAGTIVLNALQAAPSLALTPPGALATHADPYLSAADSPFVAGNVPAATPVVLGVLDARGAPVAGGNTLVELRVDTAYGARVFDLLPGVTPNGFTEVLRFTCSERCDVGHDTAAPKTLTRCAMTWSTTWSEKVSWSDATTNANGSLTYPSGWFIAGTFAFTYSGTRAADGGTDTLVKPYLATNWDASRDYAAYPPDKPAADGTEAGSFAPWDVRAEAPAAWFGDLQPYLAHGEAAPVATEQQRCTAVEQQGDAGAFYTNG